MPRIRTIKPSFWTSVAHMSRDARLFSIALLSYADDDGRFVATPASIIGYAYPMDENVGPALIKRWMREVTTPKPGDDVAFAITYSHNGFQYGYLPKFRKHQRISHPQPSTYPPPPEAVLFDV